MTIVVDGGGGDGIVFQSRSNKTTVVEKQVLLIPLLLVLYLLQALQLLVLLLQLLFLLEIKTEVIETTKTNATTVIHDQIM